MKRLTLLTLLVAATAAQAEVVTLSWNPVTDTRVTGDPKGKYVVSWGNATGVYDKGTAEVTHPTVTVKTPNLGKGAWFFAAKACNADKSQCSAWSNEATTTLLGPIGAPAGLTLKK
jgi:hypothetical protein